MTRSFLVWFVTMARLPYGAGHPPSKETLRTNGHKEALGFRWEDWAARVNDLHHEVLNAA